MATPTWFERLLSPEQRDEFTRLRVERGWSIRELHEYVTKLGVDVHMSTVGRTTARIDEWHERISDAKAMSERLVQQIENCDDDRILRANVLLLLTAIMRLITAEGREIATQEVGGLAHAVARLAQASKSEVDRTAKIRGELQQQLERLEEQVRTGRANLPLDAETLRYVRETLYG